MITLMDLSYSSLATIIVVLLKYVSKDQLSHLNQYNSTGIRSFIIMLYLLPYVLLVLTALQFDIDFMVRLHFANYYNIPISFLN